MKHQILKLLLGTLGDPADLPILPDRQVTSCLPTNPRPARYCPEPLANTPLAETETAPILQTPVQEVTAVMEIRGAVLSAGEVAGAVAAAASLLVLPRPALALEALFERGASWTGSVGRVGWW